MLGIIAGVAAWPLIELLLHYQRIFPGYFSFSVVQGVVFGAVLGAFFGSGEGLTSKEKGKIPRGTLTGILSGSLGGAVGFTLGQGILFLVVHNTVSSFQTHRFLLVPSARIIGWVILGIAVGSSEGIRAKSFKKSLVGAAGGLLGGLFGGAAIEYLSIVFPKFPYARLAGMMIFGLCTGLFYGLIERGASPGALRVLNGTSRGREYGLAQNKVTLGSDKKNDIVLNGYDRVASRHAVFRVKRRDVYLRAEDKKAPLLVNEQPIHGEQLLKYEDVIQAGSAKIFFRTDH